MRCFPVLVLWHHFSLGLLSSFMAPFPPLHVFKHVVPATGERMVLIRFGELSLSVLVRRFHQSR